MIVHNEIYDIAVIGAGLMGSAAARHLTLSGAKVVLIGPPEPESKVNYNGVFASHYDQARIYRKLNIDHDWSRLSEASIDRYGKIAEAGGRSFFTAVGSMMAGPETGTGSEFIQSAIQVGKERKIVHEQLRGRDLNKRFPFFNFPDGFLSLLEKNSGGWINPRYHVSAQIEGARQIGALVRPHEVTEIKEQNGQVVITCSNGEKVIAGKAVIACGAFSKSEKLLPEPIPMKVFARTVTFFELPVDEVYRLRTMPSVVFVPADQSCHPYVLPPVGYADGKTYMKIGGDPENTVLDTMDDVKAWFQGNGDVNVGGFLRNQLLNLMPDINYLSVSHGSCVTSNTASGKPLIYNQTDRLIALTAGNGASAKCADELGRLGAELALYGAIRTGDYRTDFCP